MMVDIKAIYVTLAVVIAMILLCIATVKKILSVRSGFTTFLMFVEEIIGAVFLGYMLSLVYKAMENYEVFVSRYGNIKDYFTYLSIYFCSSQIVILVLIYIYKFIKRHTRMIKKRRIIKWYGNINLDKY